MRDNVKKMSKLESKIIEGEDIEIQLDTIGFSHSSGEDPDDIFMHIGDETTDDVYSILIGDRKAFMNILYMFASYADNFFTDKDTCEDCSTPLN